MSDETETEDLGDEIECEVPIDSRSEWHEFSGAGSAQSGVVIFPRGVDVFCEEIGAIALRIADKGGDVEYLVHPERPWVKAGTTRGKLATVKDNGKTDE